MVQIKLDRVPTIIFWWQKWTVKLLAAVQLLSFLKQIDYVITYSFVTTQPWGSLNCWLMESGISKKSKRGILPITTSFSSLCCPQLLVGRELLIEPIVCLLCNPSAGFSTFFWEGANERLISSFRWYYVNAAQQEFVVASLMTGLWTAEKTVLNRMSSAQ